MLENVKDFFIRLHRWTAGWLVAGLVLFVVLAVVFTCIFARKRVEKICVAVCGFGLLLIGIALCGARLGGATIGAVVLTALSVVVLFFALCLGGWACGVVKQTRSEKRKTDKERSLETLKEKLEKKPSSPLKPFSLPPRVGETARETLSPLLALPKEETEGDGQDFYGREHACHLISLLRTAPLTSADAREVDLAERTVLAERGVDCAEASSALSTLVRLVARYGV